MSRPAEAGLLALPGQGLLPTSANVAEHVIEVGVRWFVGSLGEAIRSLVGGFFTASTRPPVTAASFFAPGGAYHAVASVSALLLVGCIVVGVVHALFSGEPGQAFARLVRNIPLAVLAFIGFPWLVDQLLTVADVVALAVVPSGDTAADMVAVMAFPPSPDIPGLLVTGLVFAGCLLVYLELVVRDAITVVVTAMAPLTFSAMATGAARSAAAGLGKTTVAIAFAKPAIFIALRVGTDTLLGSAAGREVGSPASWGQYVAAMAVLVIAVFMPFLVWKLLPIAEAYALAQGVSRAPFRAAAQAVQTAYWGRSLVGALGAGGGARGPAPRGGASGGMPAGPRSLPAPPGPRHPRPGRGHRPGPAAPPLPGPPAAGGGAASRAAPPHPGGPAGPPPAPAGGAAPAPAVPPGWVRRPRTVPPPGGAAGHPGGAGG